jgi:hypothetical protein
MSANIEILYFTKFKELKYQLNDPDGYQWEVYYLHEDAGFNDPHYELKPVLPAACLLPKKKRRQKLRLSQK